MDMAPEAEISPVSRESSSRETGYQLNLAQDSIYVNTQHTQVNGQNSELGQSRILNHQTSHTSSAESVGSSWNRFEIPTKNDSLSSGFPFHPRLYDLKVTHDQWSLFSSDIVNAAKVTTSKEVLAWVTGITTGTISSSVLLVLGPVAGYYTGRLVHRKTVVKTVKERLGQEGDLRSVLRRWNKDTFEEKGFEAWLELPLDPGQLHKEHLIDETLGNLKSQKKAAKKAARRFRIIIIPSSDPVITTAESTLGVSSQNIPQSGEPAPYGDRTTQELHDNFSEPPTYSPDNWPVRDGPEKDLPQASSPTSNEAPEPSDANTEAVKYIRRPGSTNS